MNEFRDALRHAGAQELEAEAVRKAPTKRRKRRRATLIGVVSFAVLASGAGAAVLISVGEPVADRTERDERFRPQNGLPGVDVRAADPDFEVPWAVGVYSAPDGSECALAGQARGDVLGRVESGRFRPYAQRTSGACKRIGETGLFSDVRTFRGPPSRTLIYGRVRTGVEAVRLQQGGRRAVARVGVGGGYVFVLDGPVRGGYRLSIAEGR